MLCKIITPGSRENQPDAALTFTWVPAHADIVMNERVEGPAERAVREEHVEINIRMSQLEGKSTAVVKNQERVAAGVNRVKGRRLCSIQDEAGEIRDRGNKRRQEVTMTPPRTGRGNMNSALHVTGKASTLLVSEMSGNKLKLLNTPSLPAGYILRTGRIRGLKREGLKDAGLKSTID